MRFNITPNRPSTQGHALVIVLIFLVVGLSVLAGSLGWMSTNATLIERSNHFFAAAAAAEAATEKVMTEMADDYQRSGAVRVQDRMHFYRTLVPLPEEYGGWSRFRFTDRSGGQGRVTVEQVSPWEVSPLISQYAGLSGYASTYRVIATATHANSRVAAPAAIQQDFQIATIPLFQFAIFYNIDLEINPGAAMTVGGRVHGNQDLYAAPNQGTTLNFLGDVTSAGFISHRRKDEPDRNVGTVVYHGEHDSGVNTLNLPLGVENTPENIRQIVEPPPSDESPSSNLGQLRYYNKSDLVITVNDTSIEVAGGTANADGVALSYADVAGFLNTNVTFFNKREGKTVKATEINVANFRTWAESSNPLTARLSRDVNSVYVIDQRTQTVDTQPGIRLVNGRYLPSRGLTIATPQPLYVVGDYNAPASALGTHNTADTKPAAFIADAVTVLSSAWQDAKSTESLSTRTAVNTTVNAAIMSGIVPTVGTSYSGGVENFPRFLENWSGKKLTYNGSMVVMFASQVATGTWKGTGNTYGIYNPPNRDWYFDLNFLDPSRLPPGTPEVRAVVRGRWAIVATLNAEAY